MALSWFENYLSGREQFVVVENAISETLSVVYGVPQGSILGPILFLICMHDIGNLDLAGTPYLFADDTTKSYRAKTKEGLQDMMSKDLLILKDYFTTNLLTVRSSQSSYMYFTNNPKTDKFDILQYGGGSYSEI